MTLYYDEAWRILEAKQRPGWPLTEGDARDIVDAALAAGPDEYRSQIQLCVEHWHSGQANEDDHGLLTYCPAEGKRGSCRLVDAQIVVRDQI